MLHRVTRPWRRARIEAGGSVTPALSASPDQWKRRRTEEKAPVARPVCLGERNGSRVRYAGCAALDPFLSPRPRKSVGDGRKRGSAKKAEELSPRDLTTGAHIEARAGSERTGFLDGAALSGLLESLVAHAAQGDPPLEAGTDRSWRERNPPFRQAQISGSVGERRRRPPSLAQSVLGRGTGQGYATPAAPPLTRSSPQDLEICGRREKAGLC